MDLRCRRVDRGLNGLDCTASSLNPNFVGFKELPQSHGNMHNERTILRENNNSFILFQDQYHLIMWSKTTSTL